MIFDDKKILLAPMAGVCDVVFRQLCIECGCELTYSEMVSAKGLAFANAKTTHLLEMAPNEDTIVVQLFGHEPDTLAHQARWIEQELGDKLYAIDINMGCPAKKITGKGDGAALMRDPSLASTIIATVSQAIEHPLTVKFRRGYEMDHETAVEFAKMAENAGASAVTIHGRYAAQLYHGQADWEVIAKIKDALDIPVVGNGDITSAKKALAIREYTQCDAVMIGRAARGNPWIFSEVKAAFAGEPLPERPSVQEKMDLASRHATLLSNKDFKILVRMRKHAMHYLAGISEASRYRGRINYATTLEDFCTIFADVAACEHEAKLPQ